MPTAFDELDLKTVQEWVESRADAQADANRAFYNGDAWQKGDAWIGPWPDAHRAVKETLQTGIQKLFTARNVIGEVVNRHSTAVAGKPLHWKFTLDRELGTVETADPETGAVTVEDEQPTEVENALIAEAEAALVTWFDRMEAQELFQELVTGALLGKRALLRLYVPPGVRDDGGNVPAGDLHEQLTRIWLQCLNLNEDTLEQQTPSGTVYVDKASRREVGIFTYTDEDTDEERAEIVYVDENEDTVLRIVHADGDLDEPVTMPLGGRLTLYEMTRRALVSPQMVSQQKALNLAETMRASNDVIAGFVERIIFNAEIRGKPVPDASVPSGERFEPDPYVIGPNTTNVLYGKIFEDADGKTHVMPPSVHYRDPVSPDTLIRSSQAAYTNILAEANQLHYASAGDAQTSGESRKQARDSYVADLNLSAGKLESAARWALETALAMAAVFAGQPGRFEGLRCYTEAKINAGPVGTEEMRAAAEMADRGVWSMERARAHTGIDDVDAEAQRINQEQQEQRGGESADLNSVQSVLDSLRGGAETDDTEAPPAFAQNGAELA